MTAFTTSEKLPLPAGGQWSIQGMWTPAKSMLLLTNPEHPSLLLWRNRDGQLCVREFLPRGAGEVLPT